MKHVYSHLHYALIISLIGMSGCRTDSIRFVEKDKYLLTSRSTSNKKQVWQPCIRHDFDSDEAFQNFRIVNGEWEIKNGRLSAISGTENRTILLTPGMSGSLRIEFDVTNYANPDGSIGDITILINSENSVNSFRSGYALTTGSYYNNCTTFYKRGVAIANTEYSPLISGKANRVVVELIEGHIRYWLNGKILLEVRDPNPLELDPNLWIGIRTWNTKMSIDWFTVEQGLGKQ